MDKQEEGGKGEGRETSEEEEGKKKKSEAGPNYYLHPSRRGRVWEGGDGMVRKGRGQEGAPSGYPPLDVVRDEDWSSCVGWMGRGVDMARARAAPVFLSPGCTSPIPVPCPLPPAPCQSWEEKKNRKERKSTGGISNAKYYCIHSLWSSFCLFAPPSAAAIAVYSTRSTPYSTYLSTTHPHHSAPLHSFSPHPIRSCRAPLDSL